MAEVNTHHGSCACGAVAYEVELSLDGLIECNCSHCYRKASSSASSILRPCG